MYILGNNVASQEEFDAHVIAEKEEHTRLKDELAILNKNLDAAVARLEANQEKHERFTKTSIVIVLVVCLLAAVLI